MLNIKFVFILCMYVLCFVLSTKIVLLSCYIKSFIILKIQNIFIIIQDSFDHHDFSSDTVLVLVLVLVLLLSAGFRSFRRLCEMSSRLSTPLRRLQRRLSPPRSPELRA